MKWESLKEILDEFAIASGQVINFNKSSILFSRNVDGVTREVVSDTIGIEFGNFKGKYLGLPSLIGRKKREILGFIRDKIMGRIGSWKNKFLSKAGREVLVKNVIQSIPTYAMSVFLLPIELCKEIERAMNGFWWGCEGSSKRGIRWKSWKDLCVPKGGWDLGT